MDTSKCLACNRHFKALLSHLAKSPYCKKEKYPPEVIEKLKKRCKELSYEANNLKRRQNYDPIAESERKRFKYDPEASSQRQRSK